MEPIPSSSAVLFHRRASGRGWVSMWSCSVTVSPGSLLLVDMWSHVAYCRPDVRTHLQLTWAGTDTGPSVSTRIGRRQLCIIPHSINLLLCYLSFERALFGCWPNVTRMHELQKYIWGERKQTQMSNKKCFSEAMKGTLRRMVVSLPAAHCLTAHISTLLTTGVCFSSVSRLPLWLLRFEQLQPTDLHDFIMSGVWVL